ncbi:MAG: hypothetical protein JXR96_23945 [Deltaproteobacteria bacterium]|nr:hypothetical protein [Deltaproteobacteria bacterium]
MNRYHAAGICLLLFAAAPAVQAGDLDQLKGRARCLRLQAQRHYDQALACFDALRADFPQDPDLIRMQALTLEFADRREEALSRYREYIERCPDCPHASRVRRSVESLESRTEGREDRSGGSPHERARRLYEQAYVLKSTHPDRAAALCRQILGMVGTADLYHAKARKLLDSLEGKQDEAAEPERPAGRLSATAEARAKALYDKAEALAQADPRGALDLCHQVLGLVGRGHALFAPTVELMRSIDPASAPAEPKKPDSPGDAGGRTPR